MVLGVVDGMGQRAFQQREVCSQTDRSRFITRLIPQAILQSSCIQL
jgi:hypothetical protein